MIAVSRALEDDWPRVRAIRLDALREAPAAFGSTYSREAAFDESEWQTRLRGTAWFVASEAGQDVGVAAGTSVADDATMRMLVGMWVAPPYRGTEVATDLVHAVRAWAAAEGAIAVTLHVAQVNTRARRFYERLGFTLLHPATCVTPGGLQCDELIVPVADP